MIASIWHGVAAAAKSDGHLDYLNRAGVPDYRATGGNRGFYVPRGIEDDRAHFLPVSFWESLGKIEGFAGTDPEEARCYPGDEDYLLDFEPGVEHHRVVEGP